MAILKEHIIENKATALKYWRYGGLLSLLPDFIDHGTGKPMPAATIQLEGFSSQEIAEAAKKLKRAPDHVIELLITNWQEQLQETRPSTIEEKKAALPSVNLSDADWESLKHDQVINTKVIEHNDYDDYRAAFNTSEEKAVIYGILKKHPHSISFFQGALDV